MKRAIVIGASSGIGREVSKLLAAEGWRLGVAARRSELLTNLENDYPNQITTMHIDVTADDAPTRLLNLIKNIGGVNLFVYCAGIGRQNPQLDKSIEAATVDTNVRGFTIMIDTVFNYMAENSGGDIVVISSIAGVKGLGVAPSYSATKAYQNTYIQALEQLSNMRRLHIRFTDVRPGFVDTPLLGNGNRYPMLMNATDVARVIVDSADKHRHVVITDWRYRLLVFLWKLVPACVWRRMNICVKHAEQQQ